MLDWTYNYFCPNNNCKSFWECAVAFSLDCIDTYWYGLVLMGQNCALPVKKTAAFQDSKSKCNFSICWRTGYLHRLDTEYVVQTCSTIFLRVFQRMPEQNRNHCSMPIQLKQFQHTVTLYGKKEELQYLLSIASNTRIFTFYSAWTWNLTPIPV